LNTSFRRQRQAEQVLILMAMIVMTAGCGMLALSDPASIVPWVLLGGWLVAAVAGYAVLARAIPNHDPLLFPVTLMLTAMGILMIGRLLPDFAMRQVLWLLISVLIMLVTVRFDTIVQWLLAYRYTLLLISLGLLAATLVLGTNPTGATFNLWLSIWTPFGPLFIQPSEILKVVLVVFLASYLSELRLIRLPGDRSTGWRRWFEPGIAGPVSLMWGMTIAVLVWQRDLGTASLIFVVFVLLTYVATNNVYLVLSGLTLLGIAGILGYSLINVVHLRISIWLNPWADPSVTSFQIVQSLMSVSSGGILGKGLGLGDPYFVPVAHSDFIFAAIAEEWGLIGVILVVLLFATLLGVAFRIAQKRIKNGTLHLLAIGFGILLATQALLIMGGTLNLVPLTGVTLPFVSYGGSSLVVSFFMIGLLLRLSANERGGLE
jgi:cell division protein FtsW (lipid II flippase)